MLEEMTTESKPGKPRGLVSSGDPGATLESRGIIGSGREGSEGYREKEEMEMEVKAWKWMHFKL